MRKMKSVVHFCCMNQILAHRTQFNRFIPYTKTRKKTYKKSSNINAGFQSTRKNTIKTNKPGVGE